MANLKSEIRVRHFFDGLVRRHVVILNPALSVRGAWRSVVMRVADCAQQASVPELLLFHEFRIHPGQIRFVSDPAQSKADWAGFLRPQLS
jgi:hypothetical protein